MTGDAPTGGPAGDPAGESTDASAGAAADHVVDEAGGRVDGGVGERSVGRSSDGRPSDDRADDTGGRSDGSTGGPADGLGGGTAERAAGDVAVDAGGRADRSTGGPADDLADGVAERPGGDAVERSDARPSDDVAVDAGGRADGGPEATAVSLVSHPTEAKPPAPSATGVGRRVVVLGGLAAVAAAAIGIARVRAVDGPAASEGGGADDELDALRRVGEAYLRVRPEEASVDVLLAALPAGATGPDASATAVALPEAPDVDAAVRADHAAGRVVEVDGWRFAETAGRLAALAHLTA